MNKSTCAALSTVLGGVLILGGATDSHAATSIRAKALNTAAAQKGDPYKSGAEGPSKFDCSGLTYYSFKKNGKKIPRIAQDQYNASKKVAKGDRTKGDLVFFGGKNSIYHVGIYAGKGYIWHAPKPGKRVEKVKLWTSDVRYGRFTG